MFPTVGKGAVIMANGDGADSLIGNLITSTGSEYRWPAPTKMQREAVPLSNAQPDALIGVYSLPPGPSGFPAERPGVGVTRAWPDRAIERTLFTLEWIQSPDLRRRVHLELNKGEARNSLARALFFYCRGAVRDRLRERPKGGVL